MRLLLFNLATDAADPVLGFAIRWIAALARRVEHVDVLTMRAGRVDLPTNVRVHSVGKERGYGEPRRAVEFYRLLARILRSGPIDACFSHMMPLFSIMAAPVLRSRGIPLVTWYAHRQVTPTVRLAYHASDRIVTSAAAAFRYRREKVSVIGQGIDTELFSPALLPPDDPPMILSVGRLAPIKNTLVLVGAVDHLRRSGFDVRCSLVGPAPDRSFATRIVERIRALALGDSVRLEGAIAHVELPRWYRRCAVHVNLAPDGAPDKAALEAMACARPSIVAQHAFAPVLGAHETLLRVPHATPEGVADALATVLRLGGEDLTAMGSALRRGVRREHGLPTLVTRLVAILSDRDVHGHRASHIPRPTNAAVDAEQTT